MKPILFNIGFTLVLVSFVACVISFWLLLYGVPVFVVGAILIYLSDKSLKRKLLSTITPLIIYIPVTFVFLRIYNYSSPRTFLIPSNYEGILRIVYEEDCGIIPRKEIGVKILDFPKNGIIILKSKFDGGNNNRYYYVDRTGNKTEIRQLMEQNNGDNDKQFFVDKKPYIIIGGGGSYGESPGDFSGMQYKNILFTDYYLINNDTSRQFISNNVKQFDSLTFKIVNACRDSRRK